MLWSWHSPQDEDGGSNHRPFSGMNAISVYSSLVAAMPRWESRQNNLSNLLSREDRVIPLAVELVPLDGQSLHLLVTDLSTRWVIALVQLRSDRQSGLRRRMPDQIHHHLPTHKGATPPVLGDVAEHPMLDRVPLARAGREVAHRDPQAGLIGELLQLHLPQPAAPPVGAAPIGRDQQPLRPWIDPAAHVPPPAPQRLHGELGGVVIDSHADPAGVGRLVVDAIGDRLPQVPLDEVVDLHLLGLPLGLPCPAAVAELAHQFLLLGIDRHYGLPLPLERLDPPVDVLELGISIRVTFALDRLAIGLHLPAHPGAVPRADG